MQTSRGASRNSGERFEFPKGMERGVQNNSQYLMDPANPSCLAYVKITKIIIKTITNNFRVLIYGIHCATTSSPVTSPGTREVICIYAYTHYIHPLFNGTIHSVFILPFLRNKITLRWLHISASSFSKAAWYSIVCLF